MNFAREGLVFIVGSALLAGAVILVAVTKRSWPLWVLGFALLVIAIWVASFFRDPDAFEALKNVVFPQVVENRPAGAAIRIWVAGCATGAVF